MAYWFTIDPNNKNIPNGYMSDRNVDFVSEKASSLLVDFNQKIQFQRDDVKRAMMRAFSERCESIPKMNRRALMDLTHDFRLYQQQVNKAMKLGDHYFLSQQAYDPSTERRAFAPFKRRDTLIVPKIGGTLKFQFIA